MYGMLLITQILNNLCDCWYWYYPIINIAYNILVINLHSLQPSAMRLNDTIPYQTYTNNDINNEVLSQLCAYFVVWLHIWTYGACLHIPQSLRIFVKNIIQLRDSECLLSAEGHYDYQQARHGVISIYWCLFHDF